MAQQLSEQQRTVRNADEFRRKFGELHKASVSVVVVRTRETYRTVQALRDFTFAENEGTENEELAFKEWTVLRGWETHDKDDLDGAKDADEVTNPMEALAVIGGGEDAQAYGKGVYTMHYPHLLNMNKVLPFIQHLKHYAQTLIDKQKRIVLLVPPGYELPTELHDDAKILDFEVPSYAELSEALEEDVLGVLPEEKRPNFSEQDRNKILSITAGMTMKEFEEAVLLALIPLSDDLPEMDTRAFMKALHQSKVDVIKKTDVLEMMEPVPLDQIGGLHPLKEWLDVRVASFSDAAREFGIEPPRGITLVGPPGGGKSLVAKATAAALDLPLVRFDVSRVFQSLVGSSEQKVRAVLEIVDSMAPCVLFLDELDKVFGGTVAGLQGDSGVGQRILGSILTWLQEGESPVFVVATANRAEYLPPEMMRRGRMDEVFSVTTPSAEERMEILRIHVSKRGHDPDAVSGLQEAVDCSNGYVGAELEAAVKDALIEAWHQGQKAGTEPVLTGDLITKQLKEMTPLSEAFKEDFVAMEAWAENNARPANSARQKGRVRTRNRALPGGAQKRDVTLGGGSLGS